MFQLDPLEPETHRIELFDVIEDLISLCLHSSTNFNLSLAQKRELPFFGIYRFLPAFFILVLPVSILAQAAPATPPPVKAENLRYVIAEAYPPGLPCPKTEHIDEPQYKDLAFTSGSNIPTRPMPDYFRYAKDPMAYARHDIQMAKNIGIDAFSFGATGYGYHTQFSDIFWDYWKAAKEDGAFKMVPFTHLLNKGDNGPRDWTGFTNTWHLLAKDYRDTFLQIDGKYVVHSRTAAIPVPVDGLTPGPEINSLLGELGGPEKVFLIQQITHLGSLTHVEGSSSQDYQSPSGVLLRESYQQHANALTQFQEVDYGDIPANMAALENVSKELGKEVAYPVMPSFYHSRWQFNFEMGGAWPGGRIREKLGIAGYYYQWRQAIDSHARIVYITTWNDNTEDHSVMPEELHGYAYYELTKYFIKWFKSGVKPPVDQEKILLFHHPQLTEKPLQVPPGGLLVGRYPNQSTPPTDYIGVVVMLKKPALVSVELGVSSTGIPNEQLASRNFPAGVNFWLIYHPLTNVAQSAIQSISPLSTSSKDSHPIYPEERDDFFVTKLDHGFEDREVFVSVAREDKNVGYFTSHRAIVGAAAAGNLGTVGDVFNLE